MSPSIFPRHSPLLGIFHPNQAVTKTNNQKTAEKTPVERSTRWFEEPGGRSPASTWPGRWTVMESSVGLMQFPMAKHIWWISSCLPHDVFARLRLLFPLFLAEFVFNVEKWKELCCMLLTVGHLVFAILVDLLVLIIVTKTMACPKKCIHFFSRKRHHAFCDKTTSHWWVVGVRRFKANELERIRLGIST